MHFHEDELVPVNIEPFRNEVECRCVLRRSELAKNRKNQSKLFVVLCWKCCRTTFKLSMDENCRRTEKEIENYLLN